MLNAKSNDHLLKSKYLDYQSNTNKIKAHKISHFKSKTDQAQSLDTTKTTNLKSNLKKTTDSEKSKYRVEIDPNFTKPLRSSFMVKPMSAKVTKKISFKENKNLFRSQSTNMVRLNRTLNYFVNKSKTNLDLKRSNQEV